MGRVAKLPEHEPKHVVCVLPAPFEDRGPTSGIASDVKLGSSVFRTNLKKTFTPDPARLPGAQGQVFGFR